MTVEILKQKGHRFLWIDDYLWMWDIPAERAIQKRIAEEAYGIVLIAGYGLGMVQKYLTQNEKVDWFRTVELNWHVVEACLKEYGEIHGDITIEDFYKYHTDFKYDCIIGDTWEDIVPESLDDYIRFKEKAEQFLKPDGKILAWGGEYFEYLIQRRGNRP